MSDLLGLRSILVEIDRFSEREAFQPPVALTAMDWPGIMEQMDNSTITLRDLAEDLGSALDRVAAGEHLVVMREGIAVAELRPLPPKRLTPRPYGLAKGQFVVPDDFDAPLPEGILREFEGR